MLCGRGIVPKTLLCVLVVLNLVGFVRLRGLAGLRFWVFACLQVCLVCVFGFLGVYRFGRFCVFWFDFGFWPDYCFGVLL